MSAFVNTLPVLLSKASLEPDFVFLSGDLAFSGNEEEYSKVVAEFLHQLREALPKKPYFFCVPGNHDVAWDRIDPEFEARIRKELSNETAVISHLMDSHEQQQRDREEGFERLKNYFQFMQTWSDLGPISMDGGYCYCARVAHLGISVGIAGLNSAWRSTHKLDRTVDVDLDLQHLLLSEPQVNQVFEYIKDADLKIALVHHPPFSEWFTSFDSQMQTVELLKFDFILRGHDHWEQFVQLDSYLPGNNRKAFHIASGALYSHRVLSKQLQRCANRLRRGQRI